MPRSATATRERIHRAAFERFSRYGFRRTSMADIASEAGVSRAALYLQFRNKEEIFRSLAQEMHEESMARAAASIGGDQPLAERLRAATEAKSLRFVEITLGSANGGELLDETNRLCGDLVVDADRRFRELLTTLFRRAAQSKEIDLAAVELTAGEAAELFIRGVRGLKGPGATVDDYRTGLAALVRVFVSGLRPRIASAKRGARRLDRRRRSA